MRFRRIYWVTEQLGEDGKSEVTGVYTSVPDLIESGLPKHTGVYRLNLCELDSAGACLLTVTSNDAASLAEGLKPMVQSGEVTQEEVMRLTGALKKQ